MSSPEGRIETGSKQAARYGSRNLFVFAMIVVTVVALVASWLHRRQRETAEAVTQFAISKLRGDALAATSDGTHPCVYASVSNYIDTASLGRCATPTVHGDGVDRFEVDLRYGTFVLRQTDLQLSDIFDVPLTRSYTSSDWLAQNRMHAFGRNSNHCYDIAPLGTRNPYTYMTLALEDGDLLYFDRASKGTGYADAVYQHTETSTRFHKSTINWNGNGWTLRLTDGSEMFFPESYKAKGLAQGAATEIRDASGNALELQRDRLRNLQEILTPHGHFIKFSYDDLSRVTRAEDDSGNWAQYRYDSYGMLTDVSHSSGQWRHYEYSDALMTQVIDETGHILVRNSYQSGMLVSQIYENGDTYKYRYVLNTKQTYAEKVIVTLPNGNQREIATGDSVPGFLQR